MFFFFNFKYKKFKVKLYYHLLNILLSASRKVLAENVVSQNMYRDSSVSAQYSTRDLPCSYWLLYLLFTHVSEINFNI